MNKIDAGRLLRMSEVVKRSGAARSALQFYEANGLIQSLRTAGNHRRYQRGVLRFIAIIRVAHRAGLPLAMVREAFAGLPEGRVATAEDWRIMSSKWGGELDIRIRKLTQLRDRLADCIGCGCLSIHTCPLRNPGDKLSERGPGPRLLGPD